MGCITFDKVRGSVPKWRRKFFPANRIYNWHGVTKWSCSSDALSNKLNIDRAYAEKSCTRFMGFCKFDAEEASATLADDMAAMLELVMLWWALLPLLIRFTRFLLEAAAMASLLSSLDKILASWLNASSTTVTCSNKSKEPTLLIAKQALLTFKIS